MKEWLVSHLRSGGHEVIDLGVFADAPCDYPDPAGAVGRAVREEAGTRGLLVCGSGIGVSIAANKIGGIRAVCAWDEESARLSRAHNDTNVLCLGGRALDPADAAHVADVWLAAGFDGGRHAARVAKITALEQDERATQAKRSGAAASPRTQGGGA